MKSFRIISRLDVKGSNLVKGVHLEGLRVLGKPQEFAKIYYKEGADEIFFQDSVASLYQRNTIDKIITETSKNIFIPLTVGGGIRHIEDIKKILRLGADKVSINTAAINNPNFINESSKSFGSSTIVIAIEAIKMKDSKYLCFTDNGREHTGIDAIDWAQEVQERGAGEILLTSIDREGTGKGPDLKLISQITDKVEIPVISHGGFSSENHISESYNAGSDAVAIASMLHYPLIYEDKIFDKKVENEGNTEFISKKNSYKMFKSNKISSIKKYLSNNNISVRV